MVFIIWSSANEPSGSKKPQGFSSTNGNTITQHKSQQMLRKDRKRLTHSPVCRTHAKRNCGPFRDSSSIAKNPAATRSVLLRTPCPKVRVRSDPRVGTILTSCLMSRFCIGLTIGKCRIQGPGPTSGATDSDAPGPTGPGQGKTGTTSMYHGVHQNYLYAAAGTLPERRLSVFRNTLKRAALNAPYLSNSESTAATRLVVALRKSAMKTSVRGRRVS